MLSQVKEAKQGEYRWIEALSFGNLIRPSLRDSAYFRDKKKKPHLRKKTFRSGAWDFYACMRRALSTSIIMLHCVAFTIAYQTAVSRCSPYVPLRFSLIIPIASCSSTGSTCNPSSCTIHSKHGSFAVTRGTFVKHLTTFSSVFLPLVLL